MSIFQKSVIQKHLANLDTAQVEIAYQKLKENYNPAKIEQIKELKEEEYQDGFLRDIFVDVLGYTLRPNENYNLAREYKNLADSKKADGAILKEEKAIAVIELKSVKTKDLKSITDQAFNYKNNQPECKYVITSNFQKLRFYIDYANEYEEFDLFNIEKDDFDLLYLLLSKESIFQNLPLKLKEETKFHDQIISAKLYKDYSQFKRKLFENLCKNHPESDKLTLFKKSQKLLDRFLFILFAEDSQLLPPNSISRIVERFKLLEDEDAYKPLYEIFKQYFGYMNIGRKGKTTDGDIPAYNGGLFYPDELLDGFTIDDDVLIADLTNLSEYDFSAEVDVNILGHIFEHSLNEIEEVTAEIEGVVHDKSKSKRKKDGIFYTPKYITQYIVENTIGTLCTEKRKELDIETIEFDESYQTKDKNLTVEGKKLYQKLTTYKEWMIGLKIVDPACGSGAFLNQALNFLIEEHKTIDDIIAELTNAPLRLFDVDKTILENNLYGVDINEESVEIAKLSLWLRTAQKGRMLSTLNNNIKCGNSLIDDPEVAGDKAFDWNKEFPEIMKKGGFDVVIGNPPYVRVQQLDYKTIDNLKTHYKTALKRIDISLCFIELSSRLIKPNSGLTSFITSNQFLTTEYGQSMRAFLLSDYNLVKCVDYGDLPVFADALTYVSIFIFKKSINKTFSYFHVDSLINAMSNNFGMPQIIDISQLTDANWNLKNFSVSNIWDRVYCNCKEISEIGNAWYGIITGADSVFIFTKDQYLNSKIEKELFIPLLRAQNCTKYYCLEPEKYAIYPYKLEDDKTLLLTETELQQKFPKGYQYLLSHKSDLEKRKDSRDTFKGRADWYCLTRFGQFNVFNKMKIVTPGEVKQHKFCLDLTNSGFSGARVFAITLDNEFFDIKYVLCLLNSTLLKSFLQSFSSLKNGGFYSYSSNILNKSPIKRISLDEQHVFIILANKIYNLTHDYNQKRNKFLKRLADNLENVNITSALEKFDEIDFKGFIKELLKQKIKLSLVQQDEWEEYFNFYKTEINQLQAEIEKTDKEIDQMVYALYELTEEEIGIVEESAK